MYLPGVTGQTPDSAISVNTLLTPQGVLELHRF